MISLLPLILTTLSLFTTTNSHPLINADIQPRQDANNHWVSTWTSMPQLVESSNMPPSPYFSNNAVLKNATLRQTLHISLGAQKIRLALSNTFGTTDLPITSASVALPLNNAAGVSGIQASPIAGVTVNGQSSFVVPKGQLVVTDEIDFEVKAGSMVTVSLYSKAGQQGSSITGHPGSRTTSWFVGGDKTNATNFDGGAKSVHWYFLSAIHASAPTTSSSLVILGDSITDGRGSTDDKNNRWTDLLHARMLSSTTNYSNIAVNNQAAGGNCVLSQCLGPSTVSRYKRDALDQPGIKYLMIFEGVNDIGNNGGGVAQQLINGYKTILADVKKAGLTTIGGTITPFGGSQYAGSDKEQARQTVNNWIKAKGNFDRVVDFAAAVASKSDAAKLDSQFNGGDSLHPNVAGYQAMANAFPLDIFD